MKIVYDDDPVHEEMELKSRSTRNETWTKHSRLLAFIRAIEKALNLISASRITWQQIKVKMWIKKVLKKKEKGGDKISFQKENVEAISYRSKVSEEVPL
jgi:hypothetical protein